MNIQQNLNALLALGAVGARTSDLYQKNAAIRKVSKEQEAVNAAVNSDAQSFDKETFEADPGAYEADLKQHVSNAEERLAADKAMAKLDPSEENFNEVSESNAYLQTIQERYEKAKKANVEQTVIDKQTDFVDQVTSQRDALQERVEMLQNKVNTAKGVIEGYKIGKGGKKNG